MAINTLIKAKYDEKVKCMAYNYCDIMSPHHWFQFPDNSVTSTLVKLVSYLDFVNFKS